MYPYQMGTSEYKHKDTDSIGTPIAHEHHYKRIFGSGNILNEIYSLGNEVYTSFLYRCVPGQPGKYIL